MKMRSGKVQSRFLFSLSVGIRASIMNHWGENWKTSGWLGNGSHLHTSTPHSSLSSGGALGRPGSFLSFSDMFIKWGKKKKRTVRSCFVEIVYHIRRALPFQPLNLCGSLSKKNHPEAKMIFKRIKGDKKRRRRGGKCGPFHPAHIHIDRPVAVIEPSRDVGGSLSFSPFLPPTLSRPFIPYSRSYYFTHLTGLINFVHE